VDWSEIEASLQAGMGAGACESVPKFRSLLLKFRARCGVNDRNGVKILNSEARLQEPAIADRIQTCSAWMTPQGLVTPPVQAAVKLHEWISASGKLHSLCAVQGTLHRNLSSFGPLLDQRIEIG